MRGIVRKLLGLGIVVMIVISMGACEELSKDVSEVTIKLPLDRMVFSPNAFKQEGENKVEGWYQKEVSYNVDSLLNANGADYLEEAIVTQLSLGVLQPSNQSLAFLRSAKVSVALDEEFEEEMVVAEADKVIPADNEINLNVHTADLRSYLHSGIFFIRVYFDINQYSEIAESTTIYVDGTLKVRMY